MSSRCRDAFALLLLALAAAGGAARAAEARAVVRVCADPDYLPYSRADGSGFENRIAEVVADELHVRLEYAWQPLGRGFVRKTVGANLCDVLIGVPAGFERVLTTRPYYRSGYVFVQRADAPDPVVSFEDPRLASLRIGVQLIGNDLAATPPGHALARHGAVDRVVGYPVFGDVPSAQRAIADLAEGQLDAAVLWGPQAGWFAARSPVPLRVVEAHAPPDLSMPFEFAIAMGVKKGDEALRQALDAVIERRRADIVAILDAYQVPRRPLDDRAAAGHGVSDAGASEHASAGQAGLR